MARRPELFVAVVTASLAISQGTRAEELRFGFGAETQYNDNLFGGEEAKIDTAVLRATPRLSLVDPVGEFQWRFSYEPAYEYYEEESEIDGWDHGIRVHFSWQLDPRTELSFSNRFDRIESFTRRDEIVTGADGIEVPEVDFGLQRFKRNSLEITLKHQLSPTRSLQFGARYGLRRDPGSRGDTDRYNLTGGYRQFVNSRVALGFGASVTRQDIDESSRADESTADFYNLFASLSYLIDPTMRLELSAGPTYVRNEEEADGVRTSFDVAQFPQVRVGTQDFLTDLASCETLSDGTPVLGADCDAALFAFPAGVKTVPFVGAVPSRSDSTTTFFANASLSKQWDRLSTSLTYSRQASSASGVGTSTIADILRLSVSWEPLPRLDVSFSGVGALQRQATDARVFVTTLEESPGFLGIGIPNIAESSGVRIVKVDDEIEYTQLILSLRLNYRVLQRLWVFGDATYTDQESRGDVQIVGDTERFRAGVGLRYEFAPIHF